MKFGIHNPSWVYGLDPAEAFEAVKAKAQWAEDHGFVWFSVMDHLIQIGGVGAPDEPFMEGWTVLAALAAVTSRIQLATLATSVGYRNPAHLAKIATVDLISRGRLTLGIGAGYLETEYRQYGWEFPARPAVRIRQMEEVVRLILAMWTEKRTTFHGRYFHVEDAILEPKPVQRPRPPVMIAGGGEQLTLRAVARLRFLARAYLLWDPRAARPRSEPAGLFQLISRFNEFDGAARTKPYAAEDGAIHQQFLPDRPLDRHDTRRYAGSS